MLNLDLLSYELNHLHTIYLIRTEFLPYIFSEGCCALPVLWFEIASFLTPHPKNLHFTCHSILKKGLFIFSALNNTGLKIVSWLYNSKSQKKKESLTMEKVFLRIWKMTLWIWKIVPFFFHWPSVKAWMKKKFLNINIYIYYMTLEKMN